MSDQQQQLQAAMHLWAAMFPVILLIWCVKITLYVIPLWRIAKRAGLNPALALLGAIPLVGRMLTLYVLAFSEWRVAPLVNFPYLGGYPPPPAMPPNYPPPTYPPTPTMATTPPPGMSHGYAPAGTSEAAPPPAVERPVAADDTDVPSAS